MRSQRRHVTYNNYYVFIKSIFAEYIKQCLLQITKTTIAAIMN